MEIRAPLTGFVVFVSNYNQGPLNARPFKVGDNVFSGMNLAEMPDMSSLVMDAKAEEIDRGRMAVGNDVRVHVDALPELSIEAKITQISPLAELGTEWPPTRSFRAYAALQHPDPRLRPGMNGGMDIVINRIPNAISIPAKAVFTRDGKPIVYVADQGTITAAPVQFLARNPDEVAVSGIPGRRSGHAGRSGEERCEKVSAASDFARRDRRTGGAGLGRHRVVATRGAGRLAPRFRQRECKKGRVTIVVAARGELQGGNSEVLTAPMIGGGDHGDHVPAGARRAGEAG